MAKDLNIRKIEAVLLAFLTVVFALIFPSALRGEKLLYWILGIMGLFLFVAGVMIIRNSIEDSPSEVESTSIEVEEWGGDTPETELVDEKEISLEELIDNGFHAKEQGQFHVAADWFIRALEHKPSYDIAFYLIVETCKHWKNGSSIHDALAKVAPYINEYMQNAPPEWRAQLLEWLKTENLPIPRENIGRID